MLFLGIFLPHFYLLSFLFILLPIVRSETLDWKWHTGRATHYGNPGDPWSIHDGHCAYGYLDPNVGTGWDIAAPADQNWDYNATSSNCGSCYEVACQGMVFTDYYGNRLDRSTVCYDPDASVIIMITDLCPCNYPANAYSNKRWCCGDMPHFDISVWAFEKLANQKWGVIAVRWRRVSCDYKPSKAARLPDGQPPEGSSRSAPNNWNPYNDKRIKLGLAKYNGNGSSGIYSPGKLGGDGSYSGSSQDSSGSSSSPSSSSSSSYVFSGNLQPGWVDMSWSFHSWGDSAVYGLYGSKAACGTVAGSGAYRLHGFGGAFQNKEYLEFWLRRNNGKDPDFSVYLSSESKGVCRTLNLKEVGYAESRSGWLRYKILLLEFDWRSENYRRSSGEFTGCSSGISNWDVSTMVFQNNWGGYQYFCINDIKLY